MKIKTLFSVAIAAFATSFVSADQGDVMITFSTPGPDKYADGQVVVDGEWYALCWSKDGSFDGITTGCKAIAADEEVVLAAPLAKGGKCPFVAFEFPRNNKYNSGKFSVQLLDTRKNGQPAASVNGLPAFVKEASIAAVAEKGGAMSVAAVATATAGSVAWVQPTLESGKQAEVDQNLVKILSFEIGEANVQVKVENQTGATFIVKSGETVDQMNSYKVAPTATVESDTATFVIPKGNAKFFSVGALK